MRPVTPSSATRKYSDITTLTRVTNYVHESRAICVCDRSHAHQPLANSCISSHSSSESRTTYTHHGLYVYATGHAHMSHSQILSYHHTHHLRHELCTCVTRFMYMRLVTLIRATRKNFHFITLIIQVTNSVPASRDLCICDWSRS